MNPVVRRAPRLGAAALIAGVVVGCFMGDGLLGQPCHTDDDCNAIAAAKGESIACSDGVCGIVCGDGRIDGAEECEDNNAVETDNCVKCRRASCGDAVVWAGHESCDDGNDDDTDSCVACRPATCGDGRVWAGHEDCDDGNDDDADSCVNCRDVRCGDGVPYEKTEACDDGNDDDDDGCNSSCEAGTQALSRGLWSAHTCAVRDGGLRCWGANADGQLGYGHIFIVGDDPTDFPPMDVPTLSAVKAVVTGAHHTCALAGAGPDNVRCWGENRGSVLGVPNLGDVVLGDAPGEVPFPAPKLGGEAVQLSTGSFATCALMADGTVRCWGSNANGVFDGLHDGDVGDDEDPIQIPLSGPARQVECSESHACALLDDPAGEVWCWGYGVTLYSPGEGPMTRIPLGGPALEVTVGMFHTCVLLADRYVQCWGENYVGQLGYGRDVYPEWGPDGLIDRVDLGGARVEHVIAGGTHTCVVLAGGDVRCWGDNTGGQLGTGAPAPVYEPLTVPPVAVGGPVRELSAARRHTCALLHGGGVRCWGTNWSGELGLGKSDNILGDQAGEMPTDPIRLYESP